MNALADKITASGDLESAAREAQSLILEQRTLIAKITEFARKFNAKPEDIVLTYGMSKLENKIISN